MPSPTDALLVLTTLPGAHDAAALARALVEERLAACISILPEMQSVYRWEGQVQQEAERQVLIKTSRDRLEALQRRLHELHPYDVPECLVVEVAGGSEAYLRWVRDSLA